MLCPGFLVQNAFNACTVLSPLSDLFKSNDCYLANFRVEKFSKNKKLRSTGKIEPFFPLGVIHPSLRSGRNIPLGKKQVLFFPVENSLLFTAGTLHNQNKNL